VERGARGKVGMETWVGGVDWGVVKGREVGGVWEAAGGGEEEGGDWGACIMWWPNPAGSMSRAYGPYQVLLAPHTVTSVSSAYHC
jgi:hypothetical protein